MNLNGKTLGWKPNWRLKRANKYAEITIGEYTIPLIGIPPEAVLEECDLCHDIFSIQKIMITECGQFLCFKCYEKTPS